MKKGFTLIEVMVVIVIMGVLAAVAVPKLFGNVAKAKVSEVSVAAGAYIKLQDVFLAEKTALGNWSAIGYVAPGNGKTNNFCYNQGTMTENTSVLDKLSETNIGWAASNVASLNNCEAGGWWSLVVSVEGSNNASYTHNASSEGCAALTIGWNVGTTMSGSCESTNVNQVAAAPQPAPQETPKEEVTEEKQPDPEPEQNEQTEEQNQPAVEEKQPEPEKTEEEIIQEKQEAAKTSLRILRETYYKSTLIGLCLTGECRNNRTAYRNALIAASNEFGAAFVKGIFGGDLVDEIEEVMDKER